MFTAVTLTFLFSTLSSTTILTEPEWSIDSPDLITSVAFLSANANETDYLIGNSMGIISLRKSPGNELVRIYLGHRGWINSLDVSSGGEYLLSGSTDNTVRLWDLFEGELLATFSMDESVDCVSFSSDEQWIIASSRSTVKIWNRQTLKEELRIVPAQAGITSFALSPLNDKLILGFRWGWEGYYGKMELWDLFNLGLLETFLVESPSGITDVDIHPSGFWVLGSNTMQKNRNPKVYLWDLQKGTADCLPPLATVANSWHYSRFVENGQKILTASDNGEINLLDFPSLEPLLRIEIRNVISALSPSSDGRFLFTVCKKNRGSSRIMLWSLDQYSSVSMEN